ncbi:MAG: alpha/beta hydrolase [Burkholderiales bacterium]|nr:alpha/beta hydrolase [Burkholderiales bacterium]
MNDNLYYTIYNTSKNHNQPWLVFLAGYTGSCETWNSLCSALLTQEDYSILLIDNLGAGKSLQPIGTYTTEEMAAHVMHIINKLNINKIWLLGHSMGGAIAQQIVLTHPDLVQHLFLISSFAELDAVARLFLIGRYELLKSGADKHAVALSTIPTIFSNRFLCQEDNQKLAMQRMINNPQTLAGMFGQLNACLKHDAKNELVRIKCYTSIITGDDDVLVNPRHSTYLHSAIINSTFNCISNAGHMVQLEQPQELANIIIKETYSFQ